MTITIHPQKALLVLSGILILLYALSIFTTQQVATALIDTPVKINFIAIAAPDDVCQTCAKPEDIIAAIDKAHNIKYKTTQTAYNSTIGAKYIEMYSITKLPAVIVTGDVANEEVLGAWKALSGREVQGNIVIEDIVPFYDIAKAQVRGVTQPILLDDATCGTCFDAQSYLGIMQRFNVVLGKPVYYDVSSEEGRALVEKYNITKIPALLLSPDIREYGTVMNTWKQVGTFEDDGWLVFREVQKVSSEFKNL